MSAAIALMAATSSAGFAQTPAASPDFQPPRARTVAEQADSIALAGDSATATAMLEAAIKRNRLDAAAWHQLGLMSWNHAKSKRTGAFIRERKTIAQLALADSALRLATQFAPDSARYWMSLAKYNLTSGISTMRFAASGQASHALEAATKVGDSLLIAQASDEVGMSTWRRYEPVVNRGLDPTGMGVSLANVPRQHAADYLRSITQRIEPPTGNTDYQNSLERFRVATTLDRTSQRYSRHFYMALGERERWEEMRAAARVRVTEFPLDFQSWQALGLASHRLGDEKMATIAFDSASATMDDDERDRMTRFTRILRPSPLKDKNGKLTPLGGMDATTFSAMPEGPRRGLESMFWLMSDPLTLTSENEYRLEFLSRVVWADMRYTSEDAGVRGADTDRGDILVRYGPPPMQITVPGNPNAPLQSVSLIWIYSDDLTFFFDIIPGFATARTFFDDKDYVNRVKEIVPVRWDNVASTTLIDTIPVRIARFRSAGDSLDAVIAARVPVDSLVRGLGMTGVQVDIDFRVYDQFVQIRGVESTQSTVDPDSATAPVLRNWTRKLGPGINVVRVEAMQMDSKRAARAMMRVDPVATSGFGMSDVLLGDPPSLRNASKSAARWTDVAITPSAGSYAVGSAIGLLWEMYDLAARDGQAKYRIAVSVNRSDRSALGRFSASVIDGLGRTVGRQQSSRNSYTISFDRAVPSTKTLVEFLSLDLADASPGSYRLQVEITDLSNNLKTARETSFVVR